MPQQKDINILPGMVGLAKAKSFKDDKEKSTIIIPVSALFTPNNQKKDHVWVVRNNQVAKQAVQVDNLTNQGAVITRGIKPGDVVVIAGVHSLTDGQEVKVVEQIPSLLESD